MRYLDASAISTTVGMPLKSGTFIHLQLAYKEALATLTQAMIGTNFDVTKAYLLYGCKNSGSGSNYIISGGAIFADGEIFFADSASFSVSGSSVAVGSLGITYYAGTEADPVDFTDGLSRNIHQVRKVAFGAALAGSGIADFNNLIDLSKRPVGGIGQFTFWKCPGTLTNYFDTTGLGIHALTLGWAIANGSNGTDDMGGLLPMPYKATDTDFDTPGTDTGGAKTTTIAQTNLPHVKIDVPIPKEHTSTTDVGVGDVVTGSSGNEPTDANPLQTDFLGDGTALNIMNPYKVQLFIQRIN